MNNPVALGMHQAVSYFSFLFAAGVGDDIRQEVLLAAFVHPTSKRDRELFLNRRLYALARSCGFRKRHRDEERPDGNWWHRPVISIEEAGTWRR